MKIWKEKLFCFKCLEGIIKDSDTYVDTEEQESFTEEAEGVTDDSC